MKWQSPYKSGGAGTMIWVFSAIALFVVSIMNHDWLYLVASFTMTFNRINIVHFQGEERDGE